MFRILAKRWWRNRFVTLMVIPERTRHVHKVVIPSFVLRMGLVLFSLSCVLMLILAVDYIHVLNRLSENKQLKGENFKLRQEMQLIRNKVETMESTIERVTNYAKKLQMLTGQGSKEAVGLELPWGPTDGVEREPASKPDRHSSFDVPVEQDTDGEILDRKTSLNNRVEHLMNASLNTEVYLSRLQSFLAAKTALMSATPSLLPIVGWISSPFGYRRHPYDGAYRLHPGIDIVAEPGTPVRAPADGFVLFSGYQEGYGKVIVLDHGNGIRTLFGHLSKLFVNGGMRIKRGVTLAAVGSTGMSTGPHLHYEVRKNGVPVNPTTFVARTSF